MADAERAEPVSARRQAPLAGLHGGSGVARLTPAAPATRLSLRARPDMVAALGAALGLALPIEPKSSASAGGRHALWLGPDEWLVIDETEADLMGALDAVTGLYSATDISHRNTAILIEGPGAANALNAGCPQDLSLTVFPVGACSRTVFGKSEVVLYRTSDAAFRVECWRSFSPYVFGLLAEGAEDAGV
ncbi:sarcosine oxidase subunit gamma [Rhizobium sp. CC-YZS058]|uniref:sarcosine oxidase subunit gamma n=1 Tax=Rhizobium sp. CC-YZS058 TaxID=3042153 RepID=UPI002B0547F1|nr:sarcosine oxidase subunit gamma [Rhizobium sp. CC-YZS058]MEA3533560.1 sarcosine oxidase subunit gamma [Rhizobium sp. CC-YZS058]